jgi:hypothetical protein
MWDKYENISDELLAAFLDGNTTKEETEQVLEGMSEDNALMEVAGIANDVISFEDKLEVWKGDYGFWEMGINPVFEPEELLAGAVEETSFLTSDDDRWLQDDFDNDLGFPNNDDSNNTGFDDLYTDNFGMDDIFNNDL